MVTGISVRGGSNGIEAHYDDMTMLARLFGSAATSTAEHALRLHGYLVNPDVVSAAVLDPYGAARFSGALLDALDGPDGLSWLAGQCGTKDLQLRAAATTYLETDRLGATLGPYLHAVTALPDLIPDTVVAALHGNVLEPVEHLPAALSDGLVDVASLFWTNRNLIGLVATYPDGRPIVAARGVDSTRSDGSGPDGVRGPGEPPRSLTDIVGGVAHRSDHRLGGDIDIRFITSVGADGRRVRHVIVDIPGIDSPRLETDGNPTSLGACARNLVGSDSSYSNGVIEAMREAGVEPGDDVMLVGHSLGGMVAMNVAREVSGLGEFHVTHVVTAGAPVARISVPRSVQVLSLENENDVVPHLDGADNPDQVNRTTVTINHNYTGGATANHEADNYVTSARGVDTSDDPSVRSYLRGIGGFLGGTQVRTQVFSIRRVTPPEAPQRPRDPRSVR